MTVSKTIRKKTFISILKPIDGKFLVKTSIHKVNIKRFRFKKVLGKKGLALDKLLCSTNLVL